MKVAVVVPAFQEESHIGEVVARARAVPLVDRVYVVDDGSSDGTAEIASREGAAVVRHPRNQGVGAALRSGFVRARADGMEILVVMGGDNQDEPREIPRLVEPIVDEGYDLVQGSRWLAGGMTVNIPLFRKITTRLYSTVLRWCTGFPFTDGTNGFRAIRAALLDRIDLEDPWLDHYELEPYILFKAVRLGVKMKEAAVTKSYSLKKGYTKMRPVFDWWRILRPVIFLTLGIKK